MLAGDIETNPGPNRNASINRSHGTAEGSVAIIAVFGTTNHASNLALTTTNFLKDPTYNGFAVNANQ